MAGVKSILCPNQRCCTSTSRGPLAVFSQTALPGVQDGDALPRLPADASLIGCRQIQTTGTAMTTSTASLTPQGTPNDLDAYWMPFTANRSFKANPRMVARAEG